jgi:glutamyl-tRNA synthetase
MTQIDNRLQEQPNAKAGGKPRLRFAPSPTGFQHIGGYRTALFSWLYARHSGGQFVLRIEDTDTTRTVEGSVEDIIEGFKWLGIDYDEGPIIGGPYGPYSQLQRKAIYQQYANELIETGHAYKCYCTPQRLEQMRKERDAKKLPPRYDRLCRTLTPEEHADNEARGLSYTVRLKIPFDGETAVPDELHGTMTFKNSDLDDIIILKSNGLAPYHLASMADDHLMAITHVLRGEDWISTSPYHVTIYRALGWELPKLYHVSNVLGKDKKKLSKRRNAPSWSDFQRQGFLPEAVFNFMALMGWSYDDKTELFTREELIRAFSLERIGVASGIYDPDKLLWMNGVYIRKLSLDELVERALPYLERPHAEGGLPDSVARPLDREYTPRVLRLEHERLKTLGEAAHVVSFFYENEISYDSALLIQKGMDGPRTREVLLQARELLAALPEWKHDAIEAPMRELVTKLGLKAGQVFGTVRTAISGRTATPPLFEMLEVLGRDVALQRIDQAITKVS